MKPSLHMIQNKIDRNLVITHINQGNALESSFNRLKSS